MDDPAGDWRYSAFISYNHADRKWATWLHRAIETYRIPKRLQGRPSQFGPLGIKLPPVFRDRDELASSSDLAASVEEALAHAATLIVVCSPNGARSRWVNEEVRTFIRMGREAQIRLIVVDGEPHAEDPAWECLPPAVREELRAEPLAADARADQDGKAGAKLKLIAGILGVPYDELRRREAARRQRRLTILFAASLAGLLVTSGLALVAWISRNEAIAQRDIARKRTLTAERTLGFVKDMFRVADPSEAKGATITAREVVDRGARSLDQGLENEPAVRAELGVTLAEVYGALGLYQRSDALIRKSIAIPVTDRTTQARQLAAMGDSQSRLADYEAAVRSYRATLARLSPDDPPELRSRVLAGLSQAESALGNTAEADRAGRQALQIDNARTGNRDSDVARDLEAIGLNLYFAGKLRGAVPYIERALDVRLRSEGAASPSVADNRNTLGTIAQREGDYPRAERYLRDALDSYRRVLGPRHPDVGTALNNLGRLYIEQRRFAEARQAMREAVSIVLPERGEMHDDMAFLFSNLALAEQGLGNTARAEQLFDKALKAARAHDHRTIGQTLTDLAAIYCASGRAAQADKALNEAATRMAADYPDDPWRQAWVENVRGECAMRQGDWARARTEIARSSPVILKRWPRNTLFGYDAARRLEAVRNRT